MVERMYLQAFNAECKFHVIPALTNVQGTLTQLGNRKALSGLETSILPQRQLTASEFDNCSKMHDPEMVL